MEMTTRQPHKRRSHINEMAEEDNGWKDRRLISKINCRDLIEQIPAVTYITALDKDGKRLYVSPQIEKMLGFSSTEWLSEPDLWVQRLHPDDRMRVLEEVYDVFENGKRFRTEYRLLARDGHIVWVRDEAAVAHDETGKPCFIQGIMVDISDLLRTEEALHESEVKFRTIFERTAVGIALVDMEGRFMESNPALQEMLGYRRKELLTKAFSELIHPEDETADLDFYKKLLAGKQDHYQIEKRYIRQDRGVIWGRENVSLVRDAEDRPQYSIHMVEDISEWKQLETQFLQSQKMETVGRLAGGIAHDLNNLFTVLSGYSQLSLLGLKEKDPLRENIEEIKKATDRASDLTHQLLAFSRRQALDMKVLDLNTLVRGLEKMLGRVIGEDIELITHLGDDLGRVKTDPHQIEQVILNLVVNARDAMPEGGKLVIKTGNIELDESYARTHIGVTPGRYVLFSVSDTGCGMSPGVRERIFDPFFTTKEKGKGTGLGLSTVYGIIKQSGGHIWVYSEPGQGTAFKIYLPWFEDEESPVLSQKDEVGEVPRGSETVLLVEDEPAVRNLATQFLRHQGYIVLEAANGEEAMGLIRQPVVEKIDLLLTDVVMPQLGGKELFKRFKVIYPDVKVLFVSGYSDKAIIHQTLFEPGAPFLEKPFSLMNLARKVREVLNK